MIPTLICTRYKPSRTDKEKMFRSSWSSLIRHFVWLAFFPAGVQAQASRSVDSLPRFIVIGNDYAFMQVPAGMRAGPTRLAFENRGKVRHEFSVVRLKAGVTVQDVLDHGPGAASSRALVDQLVGLLIARPGEAAGADLLVDLQPGRRYLIICTLRDSPDAQQHAMLGMVASFDVP